MERRTFFLKSFASLASLLTAKTFAEKVQLPSVNSVKLTKAHEYEAFHKNTKESPYILKRIFTSKNYPDKTYGSVEEFWSYNREPEGDRVNSILKNNNELLRTRSFLMRDRKTVVNYKIYRNKDAHSKFKNYLRVSELRCPFKVVDAG